MASDSILNLSLDETHWIAQLNQLLVDEDLQTINNTPVCIFHVPDSITNDKPEAYVPCRIALGPYHHLRPEFYIMEVYKLDKAKKVREKLHLPHFHHLVDKIKQHDLKTRACFDSYVELSRDGLAWIMVIDSLCLVWFLGISAELVKRYAVRDNVSSLSVNSEVYVYAERDNVSSLDVNPEVYAFAERDNVSSLGVNPEVYAFAERDNVSSLSVNPEVYASVGNSLARYEIVRDVLLLENQVPIVVLREIIPMNKTLLSLFCHFCASISPFKLRVFYEGYISYLETKLDQPRHLLHFLYNLIWIQEVKFTRCGIIEMEDFRIGVNCITTLLNVLGSVLNISSLQMLNGAISSIQSLLSLLRTDGESSSPKDTSRAVPSASELHRVGVKFKETDDSIGEASFNKAKATLTLPVITLNAFSEVLLRNLVAFELTAKLKHPVLTLYIVLMNGLMASGADVKILTKEKIIHSSLGSDEEIVELFNGIVKSSSSFIDIAKLVKPIDKKTEATDLGSITESTPMEIPDQDESTESKPNPNLNDGMKFVEKFSNPKFEDIEKDLIGIIEGIRQYHDSNWKVTAKKCLKKYMYPPIKILSVLVVVLLIVLVVVHTLCSFFSCPRVFKASKTVGLLTLNMFPQSM